MTTSSLPVDERIDGSCSPARRAADSLRAAVTALLVDVITKAIDVGVLAPGAKSASIGDDVSFALTRNAGAAFSWGVAYTADLAVVVGGIIAVGRGTASA